MNEESNIKITSNKVCGFKPLTRKKLDITKKEIIRNCSVPVPSKADSELEITSKKVISNGNKKEDKFDFSTPALHSSLKIAKNIQDIKSCKPNKGKSAVKECKPVKKVNIPFNEKVYKDLIELRVSDESLGITSSGVKPREFTASRDPEPCLSDFYKPPFDKEYTVKFLSEGIKVEKEWFYDGYSVSRAIGLLDNEQNK